VGSVGAVENKGMYCRWGSWSGGESSGVEVRSGCFFSFFDMLCYVIL
jgi:hypothetical protein